MTFNNEHYRDDGQWSRRAERIESLYGDQVAPVVPLWSKPTPEHACNKSCLYWPLIHSALFRNLTTDGTVAKEARSTYVAPRKVATPELMHGPVAAYWQSIQAAAHDVARKYRNAHELVWTLTAEAVALVKNYADGQPGSANDGGMLAKWEAATLDGDAGAYVTTALRGDLATAARKLALQGRRAGMSRDDLFAERIGLAEPKPDPAEHEAAGAVPKDVRELSRAQAAWLAKADRSKAIEDLAAVKPEPSGDVDESAAGVAQPRPTRRYQREVLSDWTVEAVAKLTESPL